MTRRKSKRELERSLDDLGGGDLPTLKVCELLSYETEEVDAERGIVRIVETGELRSVGTGEGSLEGVLDPDQSLADVLDGRTGGSP